MTNIQGLSSCVTVAPVSLFVNTQLIKIESNFDIKQQNLKVKYVMDSWFDLISLFNSISTFVGYSIPKSSM